jgi:hypothetical protein
VNQEALAGSLAQLQEHLQQGVAREDVAYDQELLALANALVDFQQAPVAERAEQFKAIRQRLGQRFPNRRMLSLLKDVRRTFRRVGRVFAREGGGWKVRLWFGWKLQWRWLLLPWGLWRRFR